MQQTPPFESHLRNAIPPALVALLIMWLIYWADFLFIYDFHRLGVVPKQLSGLKGILFMPWIHAHSDVKHILNNSVPAFLLMTLLFYSYKEIALKVFLLSWFLTGLFLWVFGANNGAHHIGMSGVIYSLAAFLFTSGVLRKYLPLQALALFIVFLYGSMIWGIFPTKERISWEGHLSGMIIGVFLAFYYRKLGPQRPKYQYEIEKELGIEPPDLEGMYLEKLRLQEEEEQRKLEESRNISSEIIVTYEFKKTPSTPPKNPSEQ
jgi:membrane associated rhomboid family serine protease